MEIIYTKPFHSTLIKKPVTDIDGLDLVYIKHKPSDKIVCICGKELLYKNIDKHYHSKTHASSMLKKNKNKDC